MPAHRALGPEMLTKYISTVPPILSAGSFQVMVNCCLAMRNVTDGVLGAVGGAGSIVGEDQIND